jgi:pimeloyl-ACP methyl ester carboxylesterase
MYGDYLDNQSDKTVIFVHGYRGNPISNFCLQARHLYDLGYNMLFICQRAHGESGGKRNGLGIIEQYDILKWIEYEEAKPGIEKIMLYGSSMGSSAIAYSSDKIKSEKVKGMVIDCAFSSVGDQLYYDSRKRMIPPILVIPIIRLLARVELKEDIYKQCGDSLKKTKVPALFIHATGDTTVPYEYGLKNYNACALPKELITVEGSQHIVEYAAGGEQTKQGLINFSAKYF